MQSDRISTNVKFDNKMIWKTVNSVALMGSISISIDGYCLSGKNGFSGINTLKAVLVMIKFPVRFCRCIIVIAWQG